MASCWNERCTFVQALWKTGFVVVFFISLCYIVQMCYKQSVVIQGLREESRNLIKRVQELEFSVKFIREKMESSNQTKVQTAKSLKDQNGILEKEEFRTRRRNPQAGHSGCQKRRCKKICACFKEEVARVLNETAQKGPVNICPQCKGEYAQFFCGNWMDNPKHTRGYLHCKLGDANQPKVFKSCNVKVPFKRLPIVVINRSGYYFVFIHLVISSFHGNGTVSIAYKEYPSTPWQVKTANGETAFSKEISKSTKSVDLIGMVRLYAPMALFVQMKTAEPNDLLPIVDDKQTYLGLHLVEEAADAGSAPADC